MNSRIIASFSRIYTRLSRGSRAPISVLFATCALLFSSVGFAISPTFDEELGPPSGEEGNLRNIGRSVDSDGNFLVVGASGGANHEGKVLIYSRQNNSWQLLQTLISTSRSVNNGFGWSVSLEGNELFVGGPFSDVSGVTDQGAVQLFTFNGTSFVFTQEIVSSAALNADDWFGFAVDVQGGWLAVSAPRWGGSEQGLVQIYRKSPINNSYEFLLGLFGAANGRYGSKLIMRGDRMLVSATEEPAASMATNRGWVYEYQRVPNGSTFGYSQVQKFRLTSPANGFATQRFGSALALSEDGSRLAVGSPFEMASAADTAVRGALYEFTRNGAGIWQQSTKIVSPVISDAENFGSAVTYLSNDRLLIGDFREKFGTPAFAAGGVHEFSRTTNWTAIRRWQNSSGVASDFFGNEVLYAAGEVVIAAVSRNLVGNLDTGRLFVFKTLFKDGFE